MKKIRSSTSSGSSPIPVGVSEAPEPAASAAAVGTIGAAASISAKIDLADRWCHVIVAPAPRCGRAPTGGCHGGDHVGRCACRDGAVSRWGGVSDIVWEEAASTKNAYGLKKLLNSLTPQ